MERELLKVELRSGKKTQMKGPGSDSAEKR